MKPYLNNETPLVRTLKKMSISYLSVSSTWNRKFKKGLAEACTDPKRGLHFRILRSSGRSLLVDIAP